MCVCADEYDAYIIVSFVNATLVLSIGETVEEVTDSGFLGTTPTISCSQLGDDALVQVISQLGAFCYHSIACQCETNTSLYYSKDSVLVQVVQSVVCVLKYSTAYVCQVPSSLLIKHTVHAAV